MNEPVDEGFEDIFDFVISDEDEVMLLIYEQETEPKNPYIEMNRQEKSAVLYRNEDDPILLTDIPEEIFDSLMEEDILMVCELSRAENEADTEIARTYEAELRF